VRVIDGIVLVGWIAFWIYWLAASVRVKATARSRRAGFVGFRVAVIVVVLVVLRAGVFKAHANPVLRDVGLAVFVAGMALAVWARVYLAWIRGRAADRSAW
jgi:hypothetical protein